MHICLQLQAGVNYKILVMDTDCLLFFFTLVCLRYGVIILNDNSKSQRNYPNQVAGNHAFPVSSALFWNIFSGLCPFLHYTIECTLALCLCLPASLTRACSLHLLQHLARTTLRGIISLSLKSIWLIKLFIWTWHSGKAQGLKSGL